MHLLSKNRRPTDQDELETEILGPKSLFRGLFWREGGPGPGAQVPFSFFWRWTTTALLPPDVQTTFQAKAEIPSC